MKPNSMFYPIFMSGLILCLSIGVYGRSGMDARVTELDKVQKSSLQYMGVEMYSEDAIGCIGQPDIIYTDATREWIDQPLTELSKICPQSIESTFLFDISSSVYGSGGEVEVYNTHSTMIDQGHFTGADRIIDMALSIHLWSTETFKLWDSENISIASLKTTNLNLI